MKPLAAPRRQLIFGWTIFILADAAGILLWPCVTYRRIDQFPEQLPALVVHSAKQARTGQVVQVRIVPRM
jgi:hypothetical protein